MTTDPAIAEDETDEAIERRMFLDGTLNGDEKMNRFAKLIDTRFGSQARRTNKARLETREAIADLRKDLAPALKLAEIAVAIFAILDVIRDVAKPLAAVVGGAITVIVFLYSVGIVRLPF